MSPLRLLLDATAGLKAIFSQSLAENPLIEPMPVAGKNILLPARYSENLEVKELAWIAAIQTTISKSELPPKIAIIYAKEESEKIYPALSSIFLEIEKKLWEMEDPVELSADETERILKGAKMLKWYGRIKGKADDKLIRKIHAFLGGKEKIYFPSPKSKEREWGGEIYRISSTTKAVTSRPLFLGKSSDKILDATLMFLEKPTDALRYIQEVGADEAEISYVDEWGSDIGDYRKGWCRVLEHDSASETDYPEPEEGLLLEVKEVLKKALFSEGVFERSDDGILDIDEVVDNYPELIRGSPISEPYKRLKRVMPSEFSFSLLIDSSGSMKDKIDLAKGAAFHIAVSLAELGIPFRILGFRSAGRLWVEVLRIGSNENLETAFRRLWALRATGYTRLGAIIRYMGDRCPPEAGCRIILISDLRPFDLGYYSKADYAWEDFRDSLEGRRGIAILSIGKDVELGVPAARIDSLKELPISLYKLLLGDAACRR